jgi:O-methyltransferase
VLKKNIKTAIDAGLGNLGWQLVRNARGTAYLPSPPGRYPIFAPFEDPEFQARYAQFSDHTLVKPHRAWNIQQLVRQTLHLGGEYVEAGVFRGGTAWFIADLLRESGQERRLSLFDSFEGMPDTSNKETDGHDPGDFGDTSLERVQALLSDYDFVDIYPGFIPDTLPPVENRTFAFAHIDVDIYQAVKDCCAFFWPRLQPGGVMLFDDYGFEMYEQAAHKAVDEFFADKRESVFALRTGQAMVTKLPE